MAAPAPTCYRHHDRRAGVSCQRCDRPICPTCMVQASVGFHCPECARGGRQRVYTARTIGQIDRPVVTQVLIALNVGVFLLGLGQGGGVLQGSVTQQAVDFGLVGSDVNLTSAGPTAIGVGHGEWYRLITGGFLHAGLLHLAMNMAALWFLGVALEKALGPVRFAVAYVVSMLAGSFGVILLSPHQVTVGASGAIFGLLGVLVAAQRAHGINIWQSGIGGLLVVNLLFTFAVPSISIGGHLGGLTGGLLCGEILYALGKRGQLALATALCVVAGLACVAGGLVAAQASV